ncbi:MAG TPA: hypothetical protein VE780_10710, partial [Thermoleophilaceae bacterium]|nr:hypothetical protein [Thermoleophilaceae bacterium]
MSSGDPGRSSSSRGPRRSFTGRSHGPRDEPLRARDLGPVLELAGHARVVPAELPAHRASSGLDTVGGVGAEALDLLGDAGVVPAQVGGQRPAHPLRDLAVGGAHLPGGEQP